MFSLTIKRQHFSQFEVTLTSPDRVSERVLSLHHLVEAAQRLRSDSKIKIGHYEVNLSRAEAYQMAEYIEARTRIMA